MRRLRPRWARLIAGSLLVAAPAAGGPDVVAGIVTAHVSVTVDPDDTGTIRVPSPFTVVPGTGQVAIHVPESGGILLLEGDRILHHFPLAPGMSGIQDLEATGELLVAGRRPPAGRITAELEVFDLETGQHLTTVRSANPYLRRDLLGSDLWRVVIDGDTVGVYEPTAGASYPLWVRGEGMVPSAEQVARARSGIGFGGGSKMVPLAGGSVTIRTRARTDPFLGGEDGEFLDAVSEDTALLLQPAVLVRSDADGDFLLPAELAVRLVDREGRHRDRLLRALDVGVRATRLVIHGRPVRVRGDRVHWMFLGIDFLEIRSAELAPPAGRGS